jgi:hypothetical protein
MAGIVPEASRYEVRAVADIRVGERHRKAMGDLDALGASILDVGLLNPVTVDTTGLLLAGERRLRAMRDVLGWEWVPVHVVDADALVVEQTENEQRQALTIAERYGLGQAMAARLGNRQGQRTDLPGGLVEQIPQVAGQKTRQIAARAAGFGNETTYRQAVTLNEWDATVYRTGSYPRAVAAARQVHGEVVELRHPRFNRRMYGAGVVTGAEGHLHIALAHTGEQPKGPPPPVVE